MFKNIFHRREQEKDFSWLLKTPIAHRGLHGGFHSNYSQGDQDSFPENSLGAFSLAAKNGLAAELDIIRLKDGAFAIFHDEDLLRMTGVAGPLREMTSGPLHNLFLQQTNEKIPTLVQALNTLPSTLPLLVEVKAKKKTSFGQGIKEISDLHHYLQQAGCLSSIEKDRAVAFQSFHPGMVHALKNKFPKNAVGLLITSFKEDEDSGLTSWQELILKTGSLIPWCQPDFLAVELSYVDSETIYFWQEWFGLPVIAWTIKSRTDFERLKNNGINSIFENFRP